MSRALNEAPSQSFGMFLTWGQFGLITFLFLVYFLLFVLSCWYQCKWFPGNTCRRNDLVYIEQDVQLYSLSPFRSNVFWGHGVMGRKTGYLVKIICIKVTCSEVGFYISCTDCHESGCHRVAHRKPKSDWNPGCVLFQNLTNLDRSRFVRRDRCSVGKKNTQIFLVIVGMVIWFSFAQIAADHALLYK